MEKCDHNPLIALRDEIRTFAAERDWDKFHTPKNLAVSISVEANELLEVFQWLQTGSGAELSEEKKLSVRHEIADVLIYLLRLADKLNVDILSAAQEKLELNRTKYPAEIVFGSAKKYTEY